MHVPPPEQAPDQPVNPEWLSGVAVSVSVGVGPGHGHTALHFPLAPPELMVHEMLSWVSATYPNPLPVPLTVRTSDGCIGRTGDFRRDPPVIPCMRPVLRSGAHEVAAAKMHTRKSQGCVDTEPSKDGRPKARATRAEQGRRERLTIAPARSPGLGPI